MKPEDVTDEMVERFIGHTGWKDTYPIMRQNVAAAVNAAGAVVLTDDERSAMLVIARYASMQASGLFAKEVHSVEDFLARTAPNAKEKQ